MRSFPFRYQSRVLEVAVAAVDEGWELWVSDGEQRLAFGGHVTVDEAIAGWRVGEDRVQELAEEVKSHVLTGKLALSRLPPDAAPSAMKATG